MSLVRGGFVGVIRLRGLSGEPVLVKALQGKPCTKGGGTGQGNSFHVKLFLSYQCVKTNWTCGKASAKREPAMENVPAGQRVHEVAPVGGIEPASKF